jgi:hypothetical protein
MKELKKKIIRYMFRSYDHLQDGNIYIVLISEVCIPA